MKHKVYVHFPPSGLGNLLLIWARAKVFSDINGLPLVTSSWWSLRWGSWWRLENKKRLYWGYFRESNRWQRLQLRFFKWGYAIQKEPAVAKIEQPAQKTLFVFSTTVIENDLFRSLRPHRDWIKKEIYRAIKPAPLYKVESTEPPVIAVHIRRGDFKISNPLTPTRFFIDGIQYIRNHTNKTLPVTVFTDADEKEINDVLALENVRLAENNPDIVDLLLMSKSHILLLSQSSTFSYWAAFLSDAIVIKPVGDWQNDLRPAATNALYFEGKVSFDDPETLDPLQKALEEKRW